MLRSGETLEIRQMYAGGLSISEIARRTGRDRKTIRKWLRTNAMPKPAKRKRSSMLDQHEAFTLEQMQKGVTSASKMLYLLQQRGFKGKIRIVRAFMAPYRPMAKAAATVRFETPPGKQAQVDWADFGYIEVDGRRLKLYCFIMVLAYSRAMYLEFVTATDMKTFMRCHINAFKFFGGVPHEILYDNVKTVVKDRDDDNRPVFNERFLDFSSYYGFRPRLCLPYHAWTKGKVERPVRYIRQNFWQGIQFCSLEDLNRQAALWRDTVANVRIHATTRVQPVVRLAEEDLIPLTNRVDFDTSEYSSRRVSREVAISYKGNRYSVPWQLVGKDVVVRLLPSGQEIQVLWQGQIVAQHELAEGKGKFVVDPAHFQGLNRTKTARPVLVLRKPPGHDEVEQRDLAYYDAFAGVD